jgi:uncharacterized protein
MQNLGPLARELSVPYYDDALPSHDKNHAERVRDLSLHLADAYDGAVDRDVLSAAAWLHDIGRPREAAGTIDDHVNWGATEATSLLAGESAEPDRIEAVEHAIRAHGVRSSSPEPATPEAKLLFDADKLEAIGAVGIVRMASILGERSALADEAIGAIHLPDDEETDDAGVLNMSHLRERAKRRRKLLYTAPGRRLGRSRWQFLEDFLDQFSRETAAVPHD